MEYKKLHCIKRELSFLQWWCELKRDLTHDLDQVQPEDVCVGFTAWTCLHRKAPHLLKRNLNESCSCARNNIFPNISRSLCSPLDPTQRKWLFNLFDGDYDYDHKWNDLWKQHMFWFFLSASCNWQTCKFLQETRPKVMSNIASVYFMNNMQNTVVHTFDLFVHQIFPFQFC